MNAMRSWQLFFLLVGLILVAQVPGESVVQAAPRQATTISASLSNPACVQALPASGVCRIEFGSLSATGSDPSFSRVEILINGKLRVWMGGVFESTAYLSERMLPGGLAVTCGSPNAGGKPGFGKSYLLTANAYMVDGTTASDSMTVFCPAYDGKTYLAL